MFRNDYQRDDSREGHREVGDKEMRWTRGISFWANWGWIYVTIQKQRGGERDEEADHGNMKEKVYVSTEKTWGDNGCRSQHQLPPCEPLRLQTLDSGCTSCTLAFSSFSSQLSGLAASWGMKNTWMHNFHLAFSLWGPIMLENCAIIISATSSPHTYVKYILKINESCRRGARGMRWHS